MSSIVYLNGKYVDAAEANISVFDRGFLFADAVYEVIPVYKSRPFFVERHLRRLKTSLASVKIPCPDLPWHAIFQELITQNGGGDLQIYLQITRGNQGLRKHDIPDKLQPSVILFTIHTPYAFEEQKKQGLKAHVIEDTRWLRCDIKTTALLGNVLLNDAAISQGAHTAILSRGGFITEGSASNVFLVDAEGVISTPPLDNLCLAGITRQIVIEIIQTLSWPFQEAKIPTETLLNARELWITSTTKEIYPITYINDAKVADGRAGKYWQEIHNRYQQLIQNQYD
jgi:D-alanine transaminase